MMLGMTAGAGKKESIEQIITPFMLKAAPVAVYSLRPVYSADSVVVEIRDENMLVNKADFRTLLHTKNGTVHKWPDQSGNGLDLETRNRPACSPRQWLTQHMDLVPAIDLHGNKYLATSEKGITLGKSPFIDMFIVSSGVINVVVGDISKSTKEEAGTYHLDFSAELHNIQEEVPNTTIRISGTGQIFELLIYDTLLSEADKSAIRGWQQFYWGR